MLPVDESGNPDYAFMEQYIKERERQIVQSYIDYTSENIQMGGALPTLNEKEWKSFLISDIFDIFPENGWLRQILLPEIDRLLVH